MNDKQPSLNKIGHQITLLTAGTAGFGALLAFLFLTVINPLPQGEASVQELDTASIILFILVAVFAFATLGMVGQRLSRPIQTWYDRLQSGTPAAELPVDVARRVLNWPFINAAIVVMGWVPVAIFWRTIQRHDGRPTPGRTASKAIQSLRKPRSCPGGRGNRRRSGRPDM